MIHWEATEDQELKIITLISTKLYKMLRKWLTSIWSDR